MKTLFAALAIVLLAGAATTLPQPAEAKGCLKGAAVGGVAGHMVGSGHGVAGAAVGCAVGHHEAKKDESKKQDEARKQEQQSTDSHGNNQPSK
ncbi:hypothetical protein [Azospirillum picis]|uniref:Outer membrane lipoprotein SlyB n=1 Tax=Azospirillum picis TaxID=488438 RepID=A0ABU0MEX5_9PROT|nr:hypothetical protein [Azospirillum picis]MBP2298080.1 outer membrane lipoprotein SlyB [Azospirillum picis]MDQ0531918.1 outer membrane lipoprotein SlyB [Azospirillum picis]